MLRLLILFLLWLRVLCGGGFCIDAVWEKSEDKDVCDEPDKNDEEGREVRDEGSKFEGEKKEKYRKDH